MKRIGAVFLGLVMLVLAPAVVPVPAAAAPVSRDQAVSYVIARGLAQRGHGLLVSLAVARQVQRNEGVVGDIPPRVGPRNV